EPGLGGLTLPIRPPPPPPPPPPVPVPDCVAHAWTTGTFTIVPRLLGRPGIALGGAGTPLIVPFVSAVPPVPVALLKKIALSSSYSGPVKWSTWYIAHLLTVAES